MNTKKLTTISLFIFGVVVTAILVAGLVFYQNKKDNQVLNSNNNNLAQDVLNQIKPASGSLILNMTEIAKHNKTSNCWMLISGKVYDITNYFGKHPGGNGAMAATCGTDSTDAYMTKDPNATSTSGGQSHSSNARGLLTDYYIGDFNQIIGQVKSNPTNPTTPQSSNTNTNIQTNKPTPPQVVPKPVVTPPSVGNVTLSMAEISKHNKSSDCWMLISNKVYNITSYFGSHPGGNAMMSATCGIDATDAYMTKDPNATTAGSRSAHSSNAVSLLDNYFIGNLNQIIGEQTITQTNSIVAPTTRGDDDYEEWDD